MEISPHLLNTHTQKNRPLTQSHTLSALSLSNAKEQQRISDGKSEEEGAKKKWRSVTCQLC